MHVTDALAKAIMTAHSGDVVVTVGGESYTLDHWAVDVRCGEQWLETSWVRGQRRRLWPWPKASDRRRR